MGFLGMQMNRLAVAAAAVLVSTSLSGAADLVVIDDPVVVPDETVLSGFYAQLLVGVALPGTQYWVSGIEGEWDMELGPAVAGTLGMTVLEGLSVEIDAVYTDQQFDPDDYDGSASTFSLMGNLKYSFALGEDFGVYFAGGAGYIWEQHLDDIDFGGWGYQVIAGASLDVTDNVAIIGEYRYQNSFAPLENVDDPDWTHEVPKHLVMVGAKLSL